MNLVAWDIETCPTPIEHMSDAQKRRHEKELRRQLERAPEMGEEDASKLVRSIHPFLGWICCISAVRSPLQGDPNPPKSWTTHLRAQENAVLWSFWNEIGRLPANCLWITFNGKAFDAPYLLQRSVHHHIQPTRTDILYTYPYRHRPHADLARLWPQSCTLDDLCDLLGVPTPKSDVTGAQVAGAVEAGRIADVARYCEGDVLATLDCFKSMPCILQL